MTSENLENPFNLFDLRVVEVRGSRMNGTLRTTFEITPRPGFFQTIELDGVLLDYSDGLKFTIGGTPEKCP